ncbi:MAG: hypothetical protein Q4C88_03060 [Akkermansia sp.]|nr:hypothetical protein [Akkermansia sp.]
MFCACVCVCAPALAAGAPQQACAALEQALAEENALLAGVTDAASAAAAVPQLHACLEKLASMRGEGENELWSYIDNTPDVKTRLVEVLERLAAQFRRLEQAEFYRCAELQSALAPQLHTPEE